jgi:tetratricopeptide (TPR) repeat protein
LSSFHDELDQAMSLDSEEKAGSLSAFFDEYEHGQTQQQSTETGQHVDQQAVQQGRNPALAKVLPDLNAVSVSLMVDALRRLRMPRQKGNSDLPSNRYLRILNIVRYLLRNRKYPPDALIYESLMAAMADPQGSSTGVSKLLQDMSIQNVPLTADVCYLALEALSVHPDYILRQEVVQMTEQHWFEFTMPAKQSIAVAMLREGQFELALNKFNKLLEDPGHVDLWVYDIFILEFGREGFFDEMLHILKKRKFAHGSDKAFRSIQLMALDMFSQGFHHEGTTFVWRDVVNIPIHNPSNGIIENVLATGARHGDTELASQALEKLASRGKPRQQHNDAIVEAFANSGNVTGALTILNLQHNNGCLLLRGTTRPVLQALLKNRDLISEAEAAIQSMHKEGPVPREVLMVTIEALAEARTSEAAMPLFKDTHLLTGKSPRLTDIGLLLRHAVKTETQYELAVAYNSGLAKIDTTPVSIRKKQSENNQGNDDATVPKTWMDQVDAGPAFDVIIPACAQMGDFELAFKFIDYAKNAAPDYPAWRSADWVKPFINLALDAQHPGVWEIVDLLDRGEDAPAMMVRKELQRRRIQKRASS